MTIPEYLPRLVYPTRIALRPVPWARAGGIAAVLSMVVALIVIVSGERRYHVRASLHVTTARDVASVTAEHVGALLGPRTVALATMQRSEPDPGFRPFVESSLDIHTETRPGEVILNLEVLTGDREINRRRVDALGSAYIQLNRATSQPTALPEPAYLAHLRDRRAELSERLEDIKAELKRLAPLAQGKVIERRKTLAGELAERRTQWQRAVDEHADAVRTHAARRDEKSPKGTIDAEVLTRAESKNTALLDDEKELLVRLAETYETLIQAVRTAKTEHTTLNQAIDELKAALVQQRDKQPELSIATVLERIEVATTDYLAATDTFTRAWETASAALTQPETATGTQELLIRQATLQRLVGDYLLEVEPLRKELYARVASLADGEDGLTQRIVVQNALRGPTDAVRTSGDRFGKSIEAVMRQHNFRLDAACRRAGGLAGRVAQRRAEIRAGLQRTADQQAAEKQQATITTLQAEITLRATERDDALRAVLDTIQEILELDAPFRAMLESRAIVVAAQRDASTFSSELVSIEAVLPDEPAAALPPDEVTYTPAVVEVIPRTQGRLGRAVTAAMLTLLITLAVAIGLTAQSPHPPRES